MFINGWVVALFGFVLSAATSGACAGPEEGKSKGRLLAEALDQRDTGYGSSRAAMTMTIANASGNTTVRKLKVEMLEIADGGDLSILTFDFPADVRGTALLSHPKTKGDDDQWLYLPSISRVKRISSRNRSGSFVGSEFSFDDLSDKSVDDFDYRHLESGSCEIGILEGDALSVKESVCEKLERVPIDNNTGYSKQVLTLDPEKLRIVSVEYYDVRGELLKILTSERFKLFDDKYWRPIKATMTNVRTKKSTTLEYDSLNFDVGLGTKDFSRAVLGR